MKPLQFLLFSLLVFVTNEKSFVNNLQAQRKCTNIIERSHEGYYRKSPRGSKLSLHISFLKNISDKFRRNGALKNGKRKRIYFERNGLNVPKDISMFGKTNVYYIRENLYNKTQNNLKENEMESFNDAELAEEQTQTQSHEQSYESYGQEQQQEQGQVIAKGATGSEHGYLDNVFSYLNTPRDYVVQEGNSPKVNIYDRVYSTDAQTLERMFENVSEVNLQLLKDLKSVEEKEKLINKKVRERVQEDIDRFQNTDKIMDVKGNIIKPSSQASENKSSKGETKKKNATTPTTTSIDTSDMDEEEKNELLKKLYIIDKKTDKYIEENVYFVIQTWVPDLKIDDTLIIIDNIEKGYNDYDISTYYEKFKKAKNNDFYYDLEYYQIPNIPQHMNDDEEIECEHVNSYNNTYNKLNNYNMQKYTYTYKTNDNADTQFNKNEPMPPVVIINTKKNSMVQEWEGKNFKNRLKKNMSHEYTRIQRAFRPFSYIDLSDITCIYKYNYLQIKMKLSHRKYKNEIYPFFVPIDKNSSDNLINFNGYKQNGDNAWSYFWHNFNYNKNTDYRFLNTNIKLNVTETKFEDINKKKTKKILRHILKERKGK